MKTEELEQILQDIKYHHLSDELLVPYRDMELDPITREQVKAHLDLCLICERRLELLVQEQEALASYQPSAKDMEMANRVLSKFAPTGNKSLMKVLTSYVKSAAGAWEIFARDYVPVRNTIIGGREFWRWESPDETFSVYARVESNGDFTIHFTSSNMGLAGGPLKVKAGNLVIETTLQPVPESGVSAKVVIERRQRPKRLLRISIEVE